MVAILAQEHHRDVQVDVTVISVPTEACNDLFHVGGLWQVHDRALLHGKGSLDASRRVWNHLPHKIADGGLKDVDEMLAVLRRHVDDAEEPLITLRTHQCANKVHLLITVLK